MGQMTPEQIAASRAARETIAELVKVGDTLTHTRCMGFAEEHIFTGFDGHWLCGRPSPDTKRIAKLLGEGPCAAVNDIAAINVTHINRQPVQFLADKKAGIL
ncbi:hypothetical protein [Phenylobacterium sp.]|uniref:hypothetical protein n=1 Tax=Phenylobacterium sp. TaxID=1871053 RepID=UPI002FC6EA21